MGSDVFRFRLQRRWVLVAQLLYQFFEELRGYLHLFVDPWFGLVICDASVTGDITPRAPANARRAFSGFAFMARIAFGLALVEVLSHCCVVLGLAIAGAAMRTISAATINTRANISCSLAIRTAPKTALREVMVRLEKELKVRFKAGPKRALPLQVPFAAHGFRTGPIALGIEEGPLPSARRSCT